MNRIAIIAGALASAVVPLSKPPVVTSPVVDAMRDSVSITSPLLCRVDEDGRARCRDFAQFRRVAGPFTRRAINAVYDANPNIDRTATALLNCGNGVFASSNMDVVALTDGFAEHYRTEEGRRIAQERIDEFLAGTYGWLDLPGSRVVPELVQACADAYGAPIGGGTSGSVDGDDPALVDDPRSTSRQGAIDRLKSGMEAQLELCEQAESPQGALVGAPPPGGGWVGTILGWLGVADKVVDVADKGAKLVGPSTAEPNENTPPETLISKRHYDDETITDGPFEGEGGHDVDIAEYQGANARGEEMNYRAEQRRDDNGFVHTERCSVGTRGCTDEEKQRARDAIAAAEAAENARKQQRHEMARQDTTTTCARLKAWWESLEQRCRDTGWRDLGCERILRSSQGCIDDVTAYMPTPDGGALVGCVAVKDETEIRRAQCESRQGVMMCSEAGCVCQTDLLGGAAGRPVLPGAESRRECDVVGACRPCGPEMLCPGGG